MVIPALVLLSFMGSMALCTVQLVSAGYSGESLLRMPNRNLFAVSPLLTEPPEDFLSGNGRRTREKEMIKGMNNQLFV